MLSDFDRMNDRMITKYNSFEKLIRDEEKRYNINIEKKRGEN